jgi:threonine dehydrogenase-like Zn-dependent dehydrogenase
MDNQAVVFSERGQALLVDERAPSLESDGVLIETTRTLISTGTELAALAGKIASVSFPFHPGYSNVGTVVDVGADVPATWLGQRVASNSPHGRYVVVDERSLRPIPASVSDDHAAFFAIAEIVLNGLRRAGLELGECVVVFGLGLLGQLLTRLCRLSGARPVIAVDLSDARLALLPDDPAIVAVRGDREDAASITAGSNNGRLADIVFDVTGSYTAIAREFDCLRPEGRFVQLGSPRGGPSPFDLYTHCHLPSFSIIGAHYGSHPEHETPANPWTIKRHAELFFDLVASGELDLEPLITRRVPFRQAATVYSDLAGGRLDELGVVLTWRGADAG